MANLLRSKADAHSTLDGRDLIRQKVKLLSIMAGAFTFANKTNYHLEANVINGIGFMQTVAEQWPESEPVIWSSFEIGESLPFPRQSIAQDFNLKPHHIVKESYLLHSGPDHDQPCWEQSSVLYAVLADRNYFGLSSAGRVTVVNDGFTRFSPSNQRPKGSVRDRPQRVRMHHRL